MSDSPAFQVIGNGQPVFFQHGLTASSEQIIGLIGEMPGIQLISMDCPGHGNSSCPEDYPPSFVRYTDSLIQLMDRQLIDKAVIGGLSMGAGISLNMATRYPERVAALILLRPAWLNEVGPQNLQIIERGATYLNQNNGYKAFQKESEFQQIRATNPGAARSIMGIFGDHQQPNLDQIIDQLVNDRPFHSFSQLKKIKVPCLILGNEDDPLHPFNFAEILAEHIPTAELKKITSRYVAPEDYRKEVRSAVYTFIKRNSKIA